MIFKMSESVCHHQRYPYGGVNLYNNNGEITILGNATTLAADLVGLKIVPPFNSNVDFTLKVLATSTDASGIGADSTHIGIPLDLKVELTGVADAPLSSASAMEMKTVG